MISTALQRNPKFILQGICWGLWINETAAIELDGMRFFFFFGGGGGAFLNSKQCNRRASSRTVGHGALKLLDGWVCLFLEGYPSGFVLV